MQQINYSIIIPHKNSPDLLSRCLASIPDRDDVQIIVVDDNSDNDKKPVVDAQKAELILLDEEHAKGAGRARNIGMEKAKGKWLLFADADDRYTDRLSVLMDKYAEDTDTDLVYLNVCCFNEKGEIWAHEIDPKIRAFLRGKSHAEMCLKYEVWTPWTRMVKREMVLKHQFRFDEIPTCNDKMFGLQCSKSANHVAAEQDVIYQYFRTAGGSITDRYRSSQVLDYMLDVRGRTIRLYQEAGYPHIPSFLTFFIRSEYSVNLPLKVKVKKYRLVLKKNHVNVFTDVMRFVSDKIISHWQSFIH